MSKAVYEEFLAQIELGISEPESEKAQKYLNVRVNSTLKGESVYIGFLSISKSSTLYKAFLAKVVDNYPDDLWEDKKSHIINALEKYIVKNGISLELFDDNSEMIESVKDELDEYL